MIFWGKYSLKVHLHDIFIYLKWFGQTNPSTVLVNILKYFLFLFRINKGIQLFMSSTLFLLYVPIRPHIISIRTDSFRVFSVYEQIHSVYSANTHSQITFEDLPYSAYSPYMVCTDLLHIFSVTNTLIPCILSIQADSFLAFRKCTQIILSIWIEIIFLAAFKGKLLQKMFVSVQLDPRLTRNYWLFGSSLTKKIPYAYSDNTQNDLRIWISQQIRIYIQIII